MAMYFNDVKKWRVRMRLKWQGQQNNVDREKLVDFYISKLMELGKTSPRKQGLNCSFVNLWQETFCDELEEYYYTWQK